MLRECVSTGAGGAPADFETQSLPGCTCTRRSKFLTHSLNLITLNMGWIGHRCPNWNLNLLLILRWDRGRTIWKRNYWGRVWNDYLWSFGNIQYTFIKRRYQNQVCFHIWLFSEDITYDASHILKLWCKITVHTHRIICNTWEWVFWTLIYQLIINMFWTSALIFLIWLLFRG